jgi:anti-sigma factor RsiW
MKNKEELLDLYLDNELSEDQENEVNTLLNTDSTFRREVELMKKIKDESN